MGRRKITSFEAIKDKNKKDITYIKRKRGLIKKAMELAMLCELSICLVIYDKTKKKLVNYNSNGFDAN